MPKSIQVFLNDDDADALDRLFAASEMKTKQEFYECIIKGYLLERRPASNKNADGGSP